MEQPAGCGLYDSNRNNDLLALLYNYIAQADIQTGGALGGIATAPSNIVVAANIEENTVGNIDPALHSKIQGNCSSDSTGLHNANSSLDIECSCSVEVNLDTAEEVTVTEEEIAEFGDFNSEIIESSFARAASSEANTANYESGEEYLSHNNICKTINDITKDQNIAESIISEMPQNTLLEAAISMSNIAPPSASAGSEFLPIQNALGGVDQPQNGFPIQTWSVGNMNGGINTSVPCEVSPAFVNSRQSYVPGNVNQAPLPAYSNTDLNNGYGLQNALTNNGYTGQQQFMQEADSTIIGNQLNQLLQNGHLRTENLPVSMTQELPSISSAYNKMNTYNQNSQYNASTVPISHSQNSNMQQTMPAYNSPYNTNAKNILTNDAYIKTRIESGGEDNVMEDRSREKKLTTTPIPSDAEKMSSSSSTSSGSLEESPSPRDLETENNKTVPMMDINSSLSNQQSQDLSNFDGLSHHSMPGQDIRQFLEDSSLANACNDNEILMMEDAVLNPIPIPENVVEIDESTMEYNTVEIAQGNDNIPVSPSSLPCTDQQPISSNPETDGKSSHSKSKLTWAHDDESKGSKAKLHRVNDSGSSWSVMKEERRKKRLEKKLKHSKQQGDRRNSEFSETVGSHKHDQVDESSLNHERKHTHHRHKHRHRSKHHHKDARYGSYDSSQRRHPSASGTTIESKTFSSTNSYSGLIPKATADPTNNANLSTPKVPVHSRSITEKVKHHNRKDKFGEKKHTNKHQISTQHPKTQINAAQNSNQSSNEVKQLHTGTLTKSPGAMTIAPAKLNPVLKEGDQNSVAGRRWQTVTAIQGPKLPPMLSERDRIPKRGRPSKKMTELNLKFKAEAAKKASELEKQAAAAAVVPANATTNIVSTYTINASGYIQELENKTKQNRRSKEKAEAFRNLLSEISKKSSIQKKTAGAKEVVGAFNAVGVRTRNRASTNNTTDTSGKKKKMRSKSKVFGGEPVQGKNTTKNEVIDEHGMYTFSELAKQYKISNSILYRAMEQSQRSHMTKKSVKVTHKTKDGRQKLELSLQKSNNLHTIADKSPTSNDGSPLSSPEKAFEKRIDSDISSPRKCDENAEKESDHSEIIKPTSLSSEKSVDPGEIDCVKRKKKKKKHKKDKGDNGKKKKNKDKKKKAKRKDRHLKELSDSVFSPETNDSAQVSEGVIIDFDKNKDIVLSSSPNEDVIKPKSFQNPPGTQKSSSKSSEVKKSSVSKSDGSTRTKPTRTGSVSSLSGDEDYDGGDSSSEGDLCLQETTTKNNSSAVSSSSNGAKLDAAATSSVFGSGIISVMPSFHGIKEHGGLAQFSEHSKNFAEVNLSRGKKHKHKRKKLVGRTKSVTDPEFLCKMEQLVKCLDMMKLSTSIAFRASSFSNKSSNVFATSFQNKPNSFPCFEDKDSFSYRDPAKHRSKQKRQSLFNLGNVASSSQSKNLSIIAAEQALPNMSTFCHAEFFKKHGFVKPYNGPPLSSFLKTPHMDNYPPKSKVISEITSSFTDKASSFPKHSGFSFVQSNKDSTNFSQNLGHSDKTTLSQPEIESKSQQKKVVKRKRGWPRGKPRGPRCKKPSLDYDVTEQNSIDDDYNNNEIKQNAVKSSLPTKASVTSKHTPDTPIDHTEASNDQFTNNSQRKVAEEAPSMSNVKHVSMNRDAIPQIKDLNQTLNVMEKGTADELVDHLKAAITATLTSSAVCSDTVAKTVDTAFASFMQGLGSNSEKPTAQGTNVKPAPVKKGRGRPPKYPKQPKLTKEKDAGDDGSKTDKHPKKLWASMHQGSSTLPDNLAGKPKKRGPGRPRKYVVVTPTIDVPVQQVTATQLNNETVNAGSTVAKPSVPFSCRRASALYSPTARHFAKHPAAMHGRSVDRKGSRGKKIASAHPKLALTGNAFQASLDNKLLKDGVITNHKAKIAVTTVLSCKALQHHAKSPSWLAAINTAEPGLYDGMDADRHMSEAIDSTIEAARQRFPSTEEQVRATQSPESTLKVCAKKSIESVVAKLKSKQHTGVISDVSSSDNTTNDITNLLEHGTNPCNDMSNCEIPPKALKANNLSSIRLKSKNSSMDAQLISATSRKRKYIIRNDEQDMVSLEENNIFDEIIADSLSCTHFKSCPNEEKAFQQAGLFSYALKAACEDVFEDEEDAEIQSLFPPPIHAGLFLRKSFSDFQLPYDVWWKYNQNLIKPQQDLATQFIKTDKNVYVDTQSNIEPEEHVCVCHVDTSSDALGCDKECLNRLMYIECSSDTCPCGEKCGNRAIQSKNWWKDIERFRTDNTGWGIRTKSDIPAGQFVLEYVGEVVAENEFRRRTIENYNAHSNHYCIQLEAGKVIDGYRVANEGRFVNHSCQPNCEMQKWLSNGEYRICLFSKQAISPGEELTYDYNFHAFNLDRQQVCRCGASNCRGVIGGKSQRVYPESALNRMSKALNSTSTCKKKTIAADKDGDVQFLYTTIYENNVQPTTEEEKIFIKTHRPFLFRNLAQIKKQHEKANHANNKNPSQLQQTSSKSGNQTEGDTALLLYKAIEDIFTVVMTCKDESGVSVAIPFINLRSKQPNTDIYDHSNDPVDLSFVEDKIVTKQYDNLEEFSLDLLHAFRNAEKHYGRKTSLGKDVGRLRRVFTSARNSASALLGGNIDKCSDKEKERQLELEDRRKNGDYIRCICGIYRDEGLMIQCEKCYVWQHCDCMRVKPSDYKDGAYLCEECDGRDVPLEVEVVPQPPSAPPGHTYYLTLLKDNVLVKQGDCVRLIHDHCLRQRTSNNPPVRTSYRLQSHSTPDRMDFFRIKKLWTDDNGDKFAYGYHFLRAQDTKHAESRLFFVNELIATPFHEIVPLEAVVSMCCVMDLETYRKGKPKGFKTEDVYICQHRVDLSLRIVNRVIRNRYPICTKPHVFDSYPVKLVTVRDSQVPDQYRKTQSRRTQWLKSIDHGNKSDDEGNSDGEEIDMNDPDVIADDVEECSEVVAKETDDVNATSGNERNVKARRLNGILSKLLKDANIRGNNATN